MSSNENDSKMADIRNEEKQNDLGDKVTNTKICLKFCFGVF